MPIVMPPPDGDKPRRGPAARPDDAPGRGGPMPIAEALDEALACGFERAARQQGLTPPQLFADLLRRQCDRGVRL